MGFDVSSRGMLRGSREEEARLALRGWKEGGGCRHICCLF